MGRSSKLTSLIPALVFAAGAALPNIASAADLLVDPPIVEVPEIQQRSGWYLRGDITYEVRDIEGATYYPAAEMYTGLETDNAWDIGFGVGYQVNDYMRVDVTGDYVFGAGFRGSTADLNFACPSVHGAGVPGTCISADTADITMFKLLANGYWDIGHFAGFTPYIGAGIGGAYVMYDDYTQVETSTPNPCGGCIVGTSTQNHNGRDSWRFAWALHAGTSYDLTENFKFDFGYSYTDISGGAIADYVGGSKPQAYDDGFTEHVFRVGVRYQIW